MKRQDLIDLGKSGNCPLFHTHPYEDPVEILEDIRSNYPVFYFITEDRWKFTVRGIYAPLPSICWEASQFRQFTHSHEAYLWMKRMVLPAAEAPPPRNPNPFCPKWDPIRHVLFETMRDLP